CLPDRRAHLSLHDHPDGAHRRRPRAVEAALAVARGEEVLDLPAIYAEYGESWLPQMLWACVGTLRLSAVSFLLAVLLGLVGALGRTSPQPLLRGLAIGYIEVCRGLPALVILYIVYYV